MARLRSDAPNLWPVIGPITSSFGQREDPVLHNGEGEFHSGLDISAPVGTGTGPRDRGWDGEVCRHGERIWPRGHPRPRT